MINNENVKTFVKQTLGCACPEEVFTYIDCQSNIKLNDEIVLSNKVNIGNRLLIYVIEVNNPNLINYILPSIVNIGKKERDGLGFNRFRLVIITDKLNEIKQAADIVFKTLRDKDERIHLHILPQNILPQ